jgi:hypothetical protein
MSNPLPVDEAPVVSGYTLGDQPCGPEDPACLAKQADDLALKTQGFWLKRDRTGHLYNPNAVVGMNLSTCTWRRASQASFQMYRQFLATANPVYLRHAERL